MTQKSKTYNITAVSYDLSFSFWWHFFDYPYGYI